MKTSTLLACCLAIVLNILPRTAKAEEVTFDFFYNSLADDGAWYNTPEYGYVWQPDVAYHTDKWRPYTDGYWAQTEDGWTWVSYENFGWATYHYGRWTRLKDIGWAWVPGYDWGPGWVSWRTNDNYVGWAPLPPKRERRLADGRALDERSPVAGGDVTINYEDVEPDDSVSYTPAVDEDYDIGPQNYCFVESRSFGAPVLSEVILPPQRNFVCVEETVNVTNIIYRRDNDRRFVYNNGPDFALLSRRSERPIPQLHLDRRDDLAYVRDGIRGGNNPTLVRNGVLQVAAPFISRNPVNLQQVKPANVKQSLQRADVVRGWQGVDANPQRVAQLRERIKDTARTQPPGPNANQEIFRRSPAAQGAASLDNNQPGREASVPPQPPVNGARPAQGPVPTGPRPALTDAERAARRDARLKERDDRAAAQAKGQPIPQAPTGPNSPGRPPNVQPGQQPVGQPPVAPQTAQDRAANRRNPREQGQNPAIPPGQPGSNTPADAGAKSRDERRAERQQAREQQAAQTADQEKQRAAQQSAAQQQTEKERQDRRALRQQEKQQQPAAPQQAPQTAAPSGPSQDERQQRRQERQQQKQQAEPQPAAPSAPSQEERQQRREERQQQRAAQAPQAAPQPAPQQERRQERQQAAQPQAPRQQAAAPQAPAPPQGKPEGDKKKDKDKPTQ